MRSGNKPDKSGHDKHRGAKVQQAAGGLSDLRALPRELGQLLAATVSVSLLLVALALLSGQFAASDSGKTHVAVASIALACAAAALWRVAGMLHSRAGPSRGDGHSRGELGRARLLAPFPCVLAVAVGWTLVGLPALAMSLLWGLVVLEEVASVALLRRWAGERAPATRRAQPSLPCEVEHSAEQSESCVADPPEEAPPDNVVQQLTRLIEEDGREVIHGTARVDFSPEQRTAHLHIAFCPPLVAPSMAEAEPTAGPAVTIKTGELQSYGVRFDVRLNRPSTEAESVWLEFFVTTRTEEQAAV